MFAGVGFWNGTRAGKGQLSLYLYRKSVADRYDTLNLFDYKKDEIEGIEVEKDGLDRESGVPTGVDSGHAAS